MKKLILILTVIGMTTTVSAQFDFDYIIGMDYEIHLDYDSIWNKVNKVVVSSNNNNSDESLLDFFIRNSKFNNWKMVACNQFVATNNIRNYKSKNDKKLVSYLVASLDNNDFILTEQSMTKDEWTSYKRKLKK